MAGKQKKPNMEYWIKFRDRWIISNGLVKPSEAAKIFNVTESYISRHAESMGLEKIENQITFRSIVEVIKKRSEKEWIKIIFSLTSVHFDTLSTLLARY